MKCPIDKTEMEEGKIISSGEIPSFVKKGEKDWEVFKTPGIEITAYHCPKCGKVELTTEAGK